ncbi:MAG: alpha-amylase family glycosyl hydrolase [Prolixibacteraceae bacterium]|jgi:glycosidase|nr:alpha-amylase family glycosyl hydrolase [Prolixibacteraceae bacterium]
MKKLISIFFFYCIAVVAGVSQNTLNSDSLNKCKARTSPEWIISGVIYQINLRAFTPEGTLKAAMKRLPKIAELGATIVYLCPVFVSDDDMDQTFWSPRQKASGMNNPRNPYRTKDYYHVDTEYGSDSDLKEFIAESHRLGLRVMLDLAYIWCGPKAVFLKDHPDFIVRDKDGNPARGNSYSFCAINFSNPELREFFWQNMEYWVKEFNVDGYRCDSSDGAPIDFWETARERLELLRPDIAMLAEGYQKENQIKAFDISYPKSWTDAIFRVILKKDTVAILRKSWEKEAKLLPGVRHIRLNDSHDIAYGYRAGTQRVEKKFGAQGVKATLVMNFTVGGVPFLYNGQEAADTAHHSIFGRMPINWPNENTPEGKSRFAFCQKLCELHNTEYLLSQGYTEWIGNDRDDAVLSYLRTLGGEEILTVMNLTKTHVEVRLTGLGHVENKNFKPLLNEGVKCKTQNKFELQPYGFWVGKLKSKR